MLSDFPAIFPTNGQLPAIWDLPEFFPAMSQSPKPVFSSPDFDEVGMNSTQLSPDSDESENTIYLGEQKSGSDEPDQSLHPTQQNSSSRKRTRLSVDSTIDERKLRRMISNRESARRSRRRQQNHLENLRKQLHRLRLENRVLSNRLKFIILHLHQVKTENEQMRLEHVVLTQKLAEIRQVVTIKQMREPFSSSAWPCSNNNAYVAPEQIPSLITY